MDVAKINGSGNVDRNSHQASKATSSDKSDHAVLKPQPLLRDVATISEAGRDTLRYAEQVTERAKAGDNDRADLVRAARARLESGQLDTPEVYRAVADAILGGEA